MLGKQTLQTRLFAEQREKNYDKGKPRAIGGRKVKGSFKQKGSRKDSLTAEDVYFNKHFCSKAFFVFVFGV